MRNIWFTKAIFGKINSRIMSEDTLSRSCCTIQTRNNMIAVCQMTSTNDKDANYNVAEKLVTQAKIANSKIAFLPENCDFVGSSKAEILSLAEPLDGPLVTKYKNLAKRLKIWLSLGGIHEFFSSTKLFNTHLIINDNGDIVGKYNKVHLFDVDIPEKNLRLMESNYIKKGEFIPEPVDTPVGKVGLSVCYDLRFPELSISLTKMGAQILTYPSGFTFATGACHWETLLRARAIENQTYVVAAAQVGIHNSKMTSWGHAMVVDPWGEICAQCTDGEGIALASIKLDYIDKVRLHMNVWNHRRNDLYPSMVPKLVSSQVPERDYYTFGQVTVSSKTVFYKSNSSIAFTNKKCVVPGHVLVTSFRGVQFMADLTPEEVADMFQTVQKVSKVMSKIHQTTSSTVVVQDGPDAGQTIRQVHVHILPRKQNDFANNDDIYTALSQHDKKGDIVWRSEEEMIEEAEIIRNAWNNC